MKRFKLLWVLGLMASVLPMSGQDFNTWLQKAQQGDMHAQSYVGWMYSSGTGVAKDNAKALYWFRRAADQGDNSAQGNLGIIYQHGLGVAIDYKQALYWYRKAAENGNINAYNSMGYMYDQGLGVNQDLYMAVYYFRKGAEAGEQGAMGNLGIMYENGRGVTKDYSMAMMWYKKAVAAGNGNAQAMYDRLAARGYHEKVENPPRQEVNVAQKEERKQDPPKEPKKVLSAVDQNIPFSNVSNENTFAVIIANEEYKYVSHVPYALNDGRVFAKYCKQTLGIPAEQVKVLENATYNDIRRTISWVQRVCNAYQGEASVIFYYSGHGIPDDANRSAYLLPIDGEGSDVSSGYKIDELYHNLGAAPAKKITVILDACFSGATRDGKMVSQAKGVAVKVKNGVPQGNMVVLSAAQGDETAGFNENEGHGLLTYYILKKLQETKGNVSIGDLSQYVTREVVRKSVVNDKPQTPTVVSSPAVGSEWQNWKLK